eukprot:3246327-Prymnesium_polylepis.1
MADLGVRGGGGRRSDAEAGVWTGSCCAWRADALITIMGLVRTVRSPEKVVQCGRSALTVRLAPLLVVHAALRVGLDLDEPANVDDVPALSDGARAARARAACDRELFGCLRELALGDREPERLAARRRIVDVALGRERRARVDGVDEGGRLPAVALLLCAWSYLLRRRRAREVDVLARRAPAEADVRLRVEA